MKTAVQLVLFLIVFQTAFTQTNDTIPSGNSLAPWFVQRFKISAGAFYVLNKTNIRVSANGYPGTDINLEKDLGIDREIATFLADAQWRISRRSRITLNYYKVNRNATHTLEKDLVFNGTVFPVNSKVNSFFNTSIFQFSYGYAILSKPEYEAGVFIGSHIVHSTAGISTVYENGGTSLQENYGFTAPLPDLGIWGGWAISNRMALNGDISYFALTLENKSGRLLAYNLNLTYKLLKSLDVTLGYTGLDFKVDITRTDAIGNFNWGYNGPVLGVTFSFGKKIWRK